MIANCKDQDWADGSILMRTAFFYERHIELLPLYVNEKLAGKGGL
jgi:hypothetical protein